MDAPSSFESLTVPTWAAYTATTDSNEFKNFLNNIAYTASGFRGATSQPVTRFLIRNLPGSVRDLLMRIEDLFVLKGANGHIHGMINLRLKTGPQDEGSKLDIASWCVEPTLRETEQRKILQGLLVTLNAYCSKHKVSEIRFSAKPSNNDLVTLYSAVAEPGEKSRVTGRIPFTLKLDLSSDNGTPFSDAIRETRKRRNT